MLSIEGSFKDFDPERNDIITRFSGLNKIAFLQKAKNISLHTRPRYLQGVPKMRLGGRLVDFKHTFYKE